MALTNEQLTGQNQSHIHMLSTRIGLHRNALDAWHKMQAAALIDGFELSIASGFRDFDRQLAIWNRKCNGQLAVKNIDNESVNISHLTEFEKVKAILLYSALPGASRHHWGTDIDVYAPNLLPKGAALQLEPWEYHQGGYFFELANWLKQHALSFGFGFPYDKYRKGVAPEPWHLSYLPIAQQCQQQLSSDVIEAAIANADMLAKQAVLENIDFIYQQFIINIGDKRCE